MEWLEKYGDFDSPDKREEFFRSHVIDIHQGDMLFSGGLDPFILYEIEDSFKRGNFIACILLCQLAIEHCLANEFLLTEHESICTRGFAQLISKARELDIIDKAMESQLTELRLMRNPHVHPRFGDGKGTYIRRVIDKGLNYNELPVADGIEAIKILGCYLNTPRLYEWR
ncbi:hypothetical protein [Methylophaga frappieri]|uniref:hypothetical protein n=1 Tax=Methylophaga frappieri (strain ATCC BAA-2434 / DSM 25690 / JAM7) TaxID=754477 RepID=UPI001248622B|nr:hypothetical protein [Methylophaga frappieri]